MFYSLWKNLKSNAKILNAFYITVLFYVFLFIIFKIKIDKRFFLKASLPSL